MLLAIAFDIDEIIDRKGKTIKRELVEFDREQKERIKLPVGDIL